MNTVVSVKRFGIKMTKKWFVIFFCAIVYSIDEVDAKFCERTEAVTRMVEETFSTAYIITYHGQCFSSYGCVKTRWSTNINRRYVPKRKSETVKYCCSGYIRTDDSSNDSDIVCEPICMPACKNGHCRAPAECACDVGYIPDPKVRHNCLPSCEKGCDHGACIAPDTCRCDFGYKLVNTTCQPVCTEPCHNGICVGPETCECLPGYRKSEKNLCEPYCSNGCDNGFCTAPETCRCNSGWRLKESHDPPNKHCDPICSQPCGNGTCVAPDSCVCNPSYRKSKSGVCEPECTPPCGNGTCIAPHICSCFPGYHIDTYYNIRNLLTLFPVCVPNCAHCKDAQCVAPNKCVPIEPLINIRHSRDHDDMYDDPNIYDDYYDEFFNSFVNYYGDTKTKSVKNPVHTSTRLVDTNTDVSGYSYGTSTPNDIHTESLKSSSDINTYSDNTSTESLNNPSDKTTHSYHNNTVTESMTNPNNTSAHSDETKNTASMKTMPWLQQHWESIFIPVLVIVTAAIIMLLVWRRAPIIIFFKGRSYVVEGDPVETNGTLPFEDIQISAINEKEKTAQK